MGVVGGATPTQQSEDCRAGVTTAAVSNAFGLMYQKEPIGTIIQVANYMSDLQEGFSTFNPSSPVVASGGAANTGLFSTFTLVGANSAVLGFLDSMADMLETFTIVGISGLDFIKLGIDVGCLLLLLRAVINSVKVVT
jgi:hypothetical protein